MRITQRRPFTPGEILFAEFMEPRGLTQTKLAELLGVERRRINEIIGGKRKITPDTAVRLSRLFGNTARFWLNLQTMLDLWEAYNDEDKKAEYEGIEPLPAMYDEQYEPQDV